MKESKIQHEIVMWLQEQKLWFCSIPNEAAAGNRVRQMKLIAMGLRKGAPDLIVFHPSGLVCLEVKNETGKQSPAQARFQEKVEALGYKYFVVKSVKEVVDIFSSMG